MLSQENTKIGVIGLGYVGLPLAVEFAKKFHVVGFDISSKRIAELKGSQDSSLEVSPEELATVENIQYSNQQGDIRDCNGECKKICVSGNLPTLLKGQQNAHYRQTHRPTAGRLFQP